MRFFLSTRLSTGLMVFFYGTPMSMSHFLTLLMLSVKEGGFSLMKTSVPFSFTAPITAPHTVLVETILIAHAETAIAFYATHTALLCFIVSCLPLVLVRRRRQVPGPLGATM